MVLKLPSNCDEPHVALTTSDRINHAEMSTCRTLTLVAPIEAGIPTAADFAVVESPAPILPTGGVLLRILVLSADPFQRGSLKAARGAVAGAPIMGFVAGTVAASDHPSWQAGDHFGAFMTLSSWVALSASELAKARIWKLPASVTDETISVGVGVLGMPGATAYAGMLDVLQPKHVPGEVVLVTAAAGAVGALVGQLAKKRLGAFVIGTAGGAAKCAELLRLGFDKAIDYKAVGLDRLEAEIRAASPKPDRSVDMVFENVGGAVSHRGWYCAVHAIIQLHSPPHLHNHATSSGRCRRSRHVSAASARAAASLSVEAFRSTMKPSRRPFRLTSSR